MQGVKEDFTCAHIIGIWNLRCMNQRKPDIVEEEMKHTKLEV